MSRPHRPLDGAAATARATLPEPEAAAFDRLASAVLALPGAALGGTLRAQLPGTAGIRWLRQEGLPPTARVSALTVDQWLSLYRCWCSTRHAPTAGAPARGGGRPNTAHGHAPGAMAVPRWGQ
ncbi:hypothetical protein [Geodermatophilus sabuli]|uniref:Uncharacterized protein n=1 Tax=Geodermatophilus sabuli TaxID=1564158 RepID=A0A285EHU5_9ACTN|nr:hypothetical protein [Geodermatophilus sabuli]MBB3086584.1 hypothetical protein [Geodermatophilus sabuli]SNX97764.1 hypothetical protein SAMN06893097_108129 [Geodermatophilus sabuli]